jgi:fatty acid desaturase
MESWMNIEVEKPLLPLLDEGISKPLNQPVLKNLGDYRRELMPILGKEIFALNPARLVGFVLCGVGAIFAFYLIVFLNPNWMLKCLLGLSIGFFTGTMGFLTHELLHGAITRNQRLQNFFGFLGLMPYLISPTYWKYVHNRLHHGKTQKIIHDPDAFPTLRIYKNSKFVKTIFPFTPGSGCKRSFCYFFFWLSFHEFVAQIYLRFRNGIFDEMNHRRVTVELTLQVLILTGFLIVAGPSNWLWVLVLPVAMQNYILMSYISTNHNLSPLTSENDPLVNSLTVTNHPIFEYLSLNFGYHVEHHLFPNVSSKHAKRIHKALIQKYPDTYKHMPKWQAMKALYKTSRIYKNSTTLINPKTLETYKTI